MKEIKPLIITNVLCVSAMMAFLAVIGPMVRALGMQEWHAGLTVALGGIMWILFSRFWGIKSDRNGRKKILITAVTGSKMTGYILSGCGTSFIASQVLVTKLKKISPEAWMKLGAVTAFTGFILTAFSFTAPLLAFALCLATFGMGMIIPAFQAITANSVSKDEQGAAAGTVSAFQGIGIIIGPLASTALYGVSPSLPFVAASCAFGVLAIRAFSSKRLQS